MKKLTLGIAYNYDSADMGEVFHLTLCGVDNKKVMLELNENS